MNDPTCESVPAINSPYRFGGVQLDPPDIATGPMPQGSVIPSGSSFILMWYTPSTATQNALTTANTSGKMTFINGDGTLGSALVTTQYVISGSALVVSATVM